MTAEERELRGELSRLAATGRGRALLQLSLRGIHHGEQAVTAGCWRDHGVAGCLFQHAYWQGVREEVFPDEGRPGDWIGSFMGAGGYGVVVDTIAERGLIGDLQKPSSWNCFGRTFTKN